MSRHAAAGTSTASQDMGRPPLSVGWRLAVGSCLVVLFSIGLTPAAWAHGGDETQEGYLLVQQALGHLAHDTTHVGVDLAMEKVDDALAAKDHDGVAIDQVERAKMLLEQHRPEQARVLLLSSITVALQDLPPATGEQTGTREVSHPLAGRVGSVGHSWGWLVVSILALGAGIILAARFRPRDNLGALRRELAASRASPERSQPDDEVDR